MTSFRVRPDDIRDVSTQRLTPAGEDLRAAADRLSTWPTISVGEVWQDVPGMLSGAVDEVTQAVSSIEADLSRFRELTLQAADTYQAMEESNTRTAEQFTREI
ncbi:MAG: hypothetical protein L0G99_14640 [Propionibacteriales bacterium]|nr:hypothetical protein [Propionibacteriales bacterium]